MSATLTTASAVGTALGGTWVAWGSGKVPVGVDTSGSSFNTVEKTGGSKTHSHGAGSYGADIELFTANNRTYFDYRKSTLSSYTQNARLYNENGGGESSHSEQATEGIAVSGTSQVVTSLPPYITCYMYKRTA